MIGFLKACLFRQQKLTLSFFILEYLVTSIFFNSKTCSSQLIGQLTGQSSFFSFCLGSFFFLLADRTFSWFVMFLLKFFDDLSVFSIFKMCMTSLKFSHFYSIQLFILMQEKQQSTLKKVPSEDEDDEIVLFKLSRPFDRNPFDELIINPNRPKKRVKLSEEEELAEEFMSKFSLKNSVQYFLSRIDESERKEKVNNLSIQKREKSANNERKMLRQEIFQKIRFGKEKQQKNLKIVDIKKEDFVDFNGEKVQVENMPESYDYYVLQKRSLQNNSSHCPRIYMPENAAHLLQFDNEIERKNSFDDMEDEDSNREDNPDYDYPDEDEFEESSDEGVIGDENGSNESLDEEELYRKYLKRCKRYEVEGQSDQDVEYTPY